MDIGIVSMRYAKALMEYAKSTGTEDRLYAEMRMLSRSVEKHRSSVPLLWVMPRPNANWLVSLCWY